MGVLDRYGEPLGPEPETPKQIHDQTCVDGLLGEDHEGRPIACLRCRPHLIGRLGQRRKP